jgi:hypothetical protein
MRTTLVLDQRLVKELMTVTGARTKTEAIHLAISELIRARKRAGLKALSGRITLAENWQDLEATEIEAQEKRERSWRGHR